MKSFVQFFVKNLKNVIIYKNIFKVNMLNENFMAVINFNSNLIFVIRKYNK